jgi:ribosomal protein L7Ae-like RNA K-turn-binding protein
MFQYFSTSESQDQKPKILHFGKDTSKTTILLISGSHGNEPAGPIYLTKQFVTTKLENCARDYNIKIIVIPKVNKLGLLQNKRRVPDTIPWDLNRAYPRKGHQEVRELIKTYLHFINKAQLVVDLHESKGYRTMEGRTKGSGIYYNGYGKSGTIVQKMVQNVNQIIDNQDHHFVTEKIKPVPGSLRYYCTEHVIPYILVETTVIETLQTRLAKLDNIITTLLKITD